MRSTFRPLSPGGRRTSSPTSASWWRCVEGDAGSLPTVAIVGRPNVGKSTLFNRLTGRRDALAGDSPGLTRDVREGRARLGGLRLRLLDTAGLLEDGDDETASEASLRSESSARESDLCLLLLDGRRGLASDDFRYAERLRRLGARPMAVINKAEGRVDSSASSDAWRMGFGEPILISAEHGVGLGRLEEAILERLGDSATEGSRRASDVLEVDESPRRLRIAIVGRPNAGKSTLLNRLFGAERSLTGKRAGITRDAVRVSARLRDVDVELIDTAGLRRRSSSRPRAERMAIADALRAVKSADVATLLIAADADSETSDGDRGVGGDRGDGGRFLSRQDLRVAEAAISEGCALAVCLNKIDRLPSRERVSAGSRLQREVDSLLPRLRGSRTATISSLRGTGCDSLIDVILSSGEDRRRRVSTGELNRWFAETLSSHPPPAPRGRRLRMRYIVQADREPPEFAVFCSRAREVPSSWTRGLENKLRRDFGFGNSPIRIRFSRGSPNPYFSG